MTQASISKLQELERSLRFVGKGQLSRRGRVELEVSLERADLVGNPESRNVLCVHEKFRMRRDSENHVLELCVAGVRDLLQNPTILCGMMNRMII